MRILKVEELRVIVDRVIKDYARVNGKAGKRFISGEITYDEYKKIMIQLSEAYEKIYENAIAKAQHQQDLKDFVIMLDSGHSIDYIRACLKQLVEEK